MSFVINGLLIIENPTFLEHDLSSYEDDDDSNLANEADHHPDLDKCYLTVIGRSVRKYEPVTKRETAASMTDDEEMHHQQHQPS